MSLKQGIQLKKANPYSVSKNLRYEVDDNGYRLFKLSEWLNQQQVSGFFATKKQSREPKG